MNSRFIWFDLLTKDIPGAKKFYSDIVGWKATKWSGGDYEIWNAGETPIGGVMGMGDAQKMGAPPHWLGYVQVADVDATVKRAEKLGGKVHKGGTDIPDTGRYAVLMDPQGAAFGIYKPKRESPPADRNALGQMSWAELNTTDWKAAWKFYAELFGWMKTSSMDMGGEMGEYFMFGTDAKQSMGGMSNAANMMKMPPHWMYYVTVKNVDETAKLIPQKGGKVLNGPMDIPGDDRIAQCMDPQGAVFAIYSHGKKK